jgi:hypothetical protein
MPFAKEFDNVYTSGIKAGLPTDWTCSRSDEKWDIPEAVCKICKSIQESTLIIADVTGKNPNVFLELGLSFGLEKKFILLTQSINDLPFDVRTFNTVLYEPQSLDVLSKQLREAVIQLRPIPRVWEESPVFDENMKKAIQYLEYDVPHTVTPNTPIMQVFVGPKSVEEEILSTNDENVTLLRCAPSFLFREIKPRYDYFEFQPRHEDSNIRVFRDGFIVSRFPCAR